ncbi:MAG: cysteine--tRNA ligase [Chthonomonadales bacterium]
MQIYNTLSRSKETFVPMLPGKAGIYCCGPTVYNYAHIGNLRTYVFEDILRRTLIFNGFEVKHVMNITDVGHLESDEDEGEDKMEKGAQREGLDPWQLARKYENAWLHDMARLQIQRPEVICRATDHIAGMVALIERIIAAGCGYVTPGAIYFDTSKFAAYADFARLDLKGLEAGRGGRVKEGDTGKRNPNDFVLWFTNKPKHIMQWDSPWGSGYPGWHIECSAMSMEYLGETFDIHCGGVDHIPVHHTNEIAQSECVTHKTFVKYWMHAEFLLLEADKMSKSSGNFLTIQSLVDEGFDPLSYRYLILQAHYRSELKFSWDTLEAAQNGLRRVYSMRPDKETLTDEAEYSEARSKALEAINDDLGTAQLLSILHTYGSYRLWKEFDAVLGLDFVNRTTPTTEELPADVTELISKRDVAKSTKDWATSDAIRKQLTDIGYVVGDTPAGTTVTRKSV